MLLHVLIWATALMLFVQSNIFCIAYSVDNNNFKNKVGSLNKREIKKTFMLDEVADFNDIQEPDDEYSGHKNVILNDYSNFINDPLEEINKEISIKTIKYEDQKKYPTSVFSDKDKISSREYVNNLITPKFNVTKDIQNNFYLNQGTATDKKNKNCETTVPSFPQTAKKPCPIINLPPAVESDMTPDSTPIPPPTPTTCSHSSKTPCDKPIQCIQNLNINQQHIQILIQQTKENASTVTMQPPSNSLCDKHKKFSKVYKSSTAAYDSGTSSTSRKFEFPKSTHDLIITPPNPNSIAHGKYLNDQLRLLSDLTSINPFHDLSLSHPEKKYYDNPDKRFINFYPTTQETASSTKNTILHLNRMEDEDYVEDTKHTNFEKPENHLHNLIKNIVENTDNPGEIDTYTENSRTNIDKRFKGKNFLRQLSNNINTQFTNSKHRNTNLKSVPGYDNSDVKLYHENNKIYNMYPTDRQATILSSRTYRDDVGTRQDYTFEPKNLNDQELNTFYNKENVNNLEYQKDKSKYYWKAFQDYELHHKIKELEPNSFENADRSSYTDFHTKFKPYYPAELPSTNHDLLINNNNPSNLKLENDDFPHLASPTVSSMPEIDIRQYNLLQKKLKNPETSNNPTDFRRLYLQQTDENFDVQPNVNVEQSVTAQDSILNPRKAQPQFESPPIGAYYYIPNYPVYNRGFSYAMRNNPRPQKFKRRRRKNYFKQYRNPLFHKRQPKKNTLKYKFIPVRKTRQIHNSIPKPRSCGGYKNDSDCKNYINNADVVLQQVQQLEYNLSQQSNDSKCNVTKAKASCEGKQIQLKHKRNLPFILPIIFANSRVTELTPVVNPVPNIQLQLNPELVQKIEAMKIGYENAMNPVDIAKIANRDAKEADASKLNPVLLQKLDELKQLIETAGNIKRNAFRSEREEHSKTTEDSKLNFDYDIITKRNIELQEKLDEAKLNLMSALKPGSDIRKIFVPSWSSSTDKELIEDHKKYIKSIFDQDAEKEYLYDNYVNDDEYSGVVDHPLKKRNLELSKSTVVPMKAPIQKRTLHLLAMKKLLESIEDIPFFLHQGADNNSKTNFPNKTTTNCYSNTTQNLTSTPFTIKLEGLVNLSISSMVSLYTPTLPIENASDATTTSCSEITANITQSDCLDNSTGEYSATFNKSSSVLRNHNGNNSTLHNNKSSNTLINSDKIFQELLFKVLNVLTQNAVNLTSIINSAKSSNHSVEQTTVVENTTKVIDKTTTIESTTKKCDIETTSEMTTVHKTVTTTCSTKASETTECTHKTTKPTKSKCTTKAPLNIFVLSSTPTTTPADTHQEISLFGDIVNLTPSNDEPIVLRKRSKTLKYKKCCTTKEYGSAHECTNQSTTTPEPVEGKAIDITKERLCLLLNIIRKSSTISPTTNCTSTTTTCPTTCSSSRKCVGKREATEKGLKQAKIARSPKNPNLQIETSAVKLISLAEHSLQLAEKYMQGQKFTESHNVERGDTSMPIQPYLFEQNYLPEQPHKFKYNLFTPSPNFYPMYILKTPKANLIPQVRVLPLAGLQTNAPSMMITSNSLLNYTQTTAVTWPQFTNSKNVTSSNSLQPLTKKEEDASEIPEYIVPMYSDFDETEDRKYKNLLKSNFYDNLNSDYSDVETNEKAATSRSDRLKRDIEVVDEIQDILDKMKLETKINTLKENRRPIRSVNIKKRSVTNFKPLLPANEITNSIEKPFDMYVIGNSDFTKDYKKRFLMFKSHARKRKHRKKKERTWKRLFGRSATQHPEHFLNQPTQNF